MGEMEMNRRRNRIWAVLVPVVLAGQLVLSGCGGDASKRGDAAGETNKDPAAYSGGPVELLVQDYNSSMTEQEFEEYFAKPVRAKYPDISLKLTFERDMQKLISGGTPPDLVAVSNARINEYFDIDYPEELTPFIKRFNINLNDFDASVAEAIKGLGHGGIYGLPFGINYAATLYNKDIFDKFGVAYPKDVITWDEFLELSKRLTRSENGIQYIGGTPNSIPTLLKAYGASNVDAKDERAVLTTEKHRAVFSLLRQFFDIPGLVQGNTYLYTGITSTNIALQTNWINGITAKVTTDAMKYNWDLSAYPVFKERPNLGAAVDFHMFLVNKASKNKEAAYRVILTILSHEAQEALTKNNPRITPYKDAKLKQAFLQNFKAFEGKNLMSIFKVSPAPLPDYTRWSTVINPFVEELVKDIALNNKDINTAMREYEEKANKAIEAAIAAKK
jgi:multiple sugar transport system substrate-binding protein